MLNSPILASHPTRRGRLGKPAAQLHDDPIWIFEPKQLQIPETRTILDFIGCGNDLGSKFFQARRNGRGIVSCDADAEVINSR